MKSKIEKSLELKNDILSKVGEYYRLVHLDNAEFAPGQRIPYASRVFDERELQNLVDSALQFWLTADRYARQFEEGLAQYIGVKRCHAVNSGSSANLLAFMALTSDLLGKRKVNRGDEVITVAAGFPTTIAPIVQYGAVPVFVDIELGTYNIDGTMLEEAFSPKTRAVMLAHTLGNPFDVNAVKSFCDRHGLWLIEDNCDALGSEYDGKKTGSFGDIATSSFFPAHHITTGEGGAVFSDNARLNRILLSMRDWGRDCHCPAGHDNTCKKRFSKQYGGLPFGYDHKYVYSHFGYNLKMTDMQAAIGCAQLDKLPGFVEKRRANWQRLLKGVQGLQDDVILPVACDNSEPSWFGFILTIRPDSGLDRNTVVNQLEAAGIQTRMLFSGNMVKQPCSQRNKYLYRQAGELVNTDLVMNNGFWVGVYPGLSNVMVDFIITNITKTFVNHAEL